MAAELIDNREAHEKIAPACEGERCAIRTHCEVSRCLDVGPVGRSDGVLRSSRAIRRSNEAPLNPGHRDRTALPRGRSRSRDRWFCQRLEILT